MKKLLLTMCIFGTLNLFAYPEPFRAEKTTKVETKTVGQTGIDLGCEVLREADFYFELECTLLKRNQVRVVKICFMDLEGVLYSVRCLEPFLEEK